MLKRLFMMAAFLTTAACSSTPEQEPHALAIIQHDRPGAHFENGKFHNSEFTLKVTPASLYKTFMAAKHSSSTPDHPLPVRSIPEQELEISDIDRLYRLGHSTVLLELAGHWIITDPIFSQKIFPVVGPERFEAAPVTAEQLPSLKAVVISHNHLDHLDKHSILQLKDKTEYFIVPLKVGSLLRRWGIPNNKIVELDWWQGVALEGLKITATPAQHMSGRGVFDRDKTLWASFVFSTDNTRIFFSGDTGYFSGFAEIGEYFESFDLTLMEVGAYNEMWSGNHLLPKDGMQAHLDLNANVMVPIHNVTFDQSKHAWWDPLEAMEALGKANDIKVLLPRLGEVVYIHKPETTDTWWKPFIK